MNGGSNFALGGSLFGRQARFERRLKWARLLRVARAVVRGEISYYPPFVEAFERSFAEYIGCRHGLTFSNGTSAIEAALFAVGVRSGDDVLVPAHTFHASITPILNAGARPVFCDIDLDAQTLDPEEVGRRVTSRSRAVVVVHLFGNPAQIVRIRAACDELGLALVEDASHAHGARFGEARVGSFGHVGCFSLQGDKSVAAGEGGIAVTDRDDLFDRLSLYGHFGRHGDRVGSRWADLSETGVGHKRRAHPLGICMAQVDLEHLERRNEVRRRLRRRLLDELADLPDLHLVRGYTEAQPGGFYPGLPVRLDRGVLSRLSAHELVSGLRTRGIPAAPYPYGGYHRMPHMVDPAYRDALLFGADRPEAHRGELPQLPATEAAQAGTVLLPLPEYPHSGYVDRTRSALQDLLGGGGG